MRRTAVVKFTRVATKKQLRRSAVLLRVATTKEKVDWEHEFFRKCELLVTERLW
jgi:hypothetical protein